MLGKASEIRTWVITDTMDDYGSCKNDIAIKINNWLKENKTMDIIDIKFNFTGEGRNVKRTALIIYKEHVEFTNPFEEEFQ